MSKCVTVRILPLESFRPLEHPKTAFLSRDIAESLELGVGNIVKLSVGSRVSAARVVPAKDLRRAITLMYSLRLSLGIAPDRDAEICVEKVSPVKAERVVLRPEAGTVREVSYLPTALLVPSPAPPFAPITVFRLIPVQGDVELKEFMLRIKLDLKELMLGAPYVKDDYIMLVSGSLFTETEAVFIVADTRPERVVTVTNETDVKVEVPEHS